MQHALTHDTHASRNACIRSSNTSCIHCVFPVCLPSASPPPADVWLSLTVSIWAAPSFQEVDFPLKLKNWKHLATKRALIFRHDWGWKLRHYHVNCSFDLHFGLKIFLFSLPVHFHSFIYKAWVERRGNTLGIIWRRNEYENQRINLHALFCSFLLSACFPWLALRMCVRSDEFGVNRHDRSKPDSGADLTFINRVILIQQP